jgi:hypothetical protein
VQRLAALIENLVLQVVLLLLVLVVLLMVLLVVVVVLLLAGVGVDFGGVVGGGFVVG